MVKSVVLFVSHLTAIARLRVRRVAVLAASSECVLLRGRVTAVVLADY